MKEITNLPPLPTVEHIRNTVKDGYYVRAMVPETEIESFKAILKENGWEWRESSRYTVERKETQLRNLASLEVAGYAKLIPMHSVQICHDGQTIYGYSDFITPYLLIDGRIYYIDNPNDRPGTTHKLSLPSETSLYAKLPYSNGWYWKEPEPQKVGKGNVKKLQAWVDWLDAREKSVAEFFSASVKIENDFMDRLKASGVNYKRSGKTVYIYNGPFKLEVTIGDKEIYSNRIETDFHRYYAELKMPMPDKIDFMLNAKINIEL